MTEEVSTYTQLAVILVCTSVIISVIVSVLIMGLRVMNNYVDQYTIITANTSSNAIIALTTAGEVPSPVAYSAIEEGITDIDVVYIEDNARTKLYAYNDSNYQNLMQLMTLHKNHMVTVTVVTGELNREMYTVTVKVVK